MLKIREITVADLQNSQDKHILVDVREPHELLGPEGHIDGVIPAPLGARLADFLGSADPHQSYVFVCRSGYRSGQACGIAHTYGFRNVYNMIGGMIAWKERLGLEPLIQC